MTPVRKLMTVCCGVIALYALALAVPELFGAACTGTRESGAACNAAGDAKNLIFFVGFLPAASALLGLLTVVCWRGVRVLRSRSSEGS
jgi:hypothetical protein